MSGIWWGMLSSGTPATATMNLIDTDSGKRPSLGIFYRNWHDGGAWPAGAYNTVGAGSTLRTDLDSIYARGQIPMVDWYSDQASDPAFSMKSIYSVKRHDAFLVQFFQDIAAWGKPVMIRFDPEMNGTWHPAYCDLSTTFGNAGEKNAAGDFALMWKYVVDTALAQGATNVTWVFCPNYQPPSPSLTYASLLPTPIKKYVQWLGFDLYNWGGSAPGGGKTSPWFTFRQCARGGGTAAGWLGDTWAETIALDPDLPIMIGEFGCDTREGTDTNASAATTAVWNGQKKADWFTDAFGVQIPGGSGGEFARIGAVCYFNTTDAGAAPPIAGGFTTGNGDWPIEDPTAASGKPGGGIPQTTFQGANGPGGSAYYVAGNQFLLPAGMRTIPRYEGVPQPSRFTNAILHTAPGHLVGWWKGNDPSGTTAVDAGSGANNGVYTGGFTLAQPKIVRGALDLSTLLNGSSGYVTVPDAAAYSLVTTGKLTVMIAFQIVVLPTAFGTIFSKANLAGTGYEWALRTSNLGAFEGIHWNLVGNPYSDVAFGSSSIAVGTSYLAIWTMDQSRSPVGRVGFAAAGAAAMSFLNSSDTLANAPADGTGTVDIGRRGDNTSYTNMYWQHAAIWNAAISDLSMNELLKAFNAARPAPQMYVG